MRWTRHNGAGNASKYFSFKELECKDGICKEQFMNDQFLDMLDEVRELYGQPILVTSAFRCAHHQNTLRQKGYETASGTSSHEQGIAADIRPTTMEFMPQLLGAVQQVFKNYSIGVASGFIHVDSRPGGPRRWGYQNEKR